jgi:hypothetical protein
VQGILRYPDNSPIAGASIKFIASKFISSGVPIGASLVIITDTIGAYSKNILEGSYHIFFKMSGQTLYTHLIDINLAAGMGGVAIGDPITLEDIIGSGPGDTPVYTGCSTIPIPTTFTVTSGFTTIILNWTVPTYTCHAVTEIWVGATNLFANKVLLATTEAGIYSHAIGHDGTRHYWIRFRNLNGDFGNWYSTSAVTGETSQDPGMVLADLQQDIYASTIFAALRSNINSSFYQSNAPTVKANGDALISGDTWIDSDTGQRHVWDTSQVPSAWLATVDSATQEALSRLTSTEAVADGVIKGFFQTTEPLTAESSFGDIWINTGLPTPLTFSAIKRYEANDLSSTPPLSWRSAPTSALGLSYVKAFNTEGDLSNLKSSYDTFVGVTLPADLSEIQAQLDGSITTWFKDVVPTLSNLPASGWTDNTTKNVHLGDLYYNRTTGYAYRFAYEDIVDDPNLGVIYSWVQISDTDIAAALLAASNAQDTADDKRRVFVNTPSTPYDVGDLWTTGTILKRCKTTKLTGSYDAANWELATSYVTTYYTNKVPAPSDPYMGDLWVVLDEADALYRYTGTAWVLLSVATLANVDTQITEQKGICRTSVGVLTTHKNETLCVAVTGNTWESLGALAIRTDLVSTTVGTNTSTISTQATSINGLQSEYAVKIDNNGNVSGFGLSSVSAGCLVNGILDTSIVQTACTGTSKTWVTDSSTFLVAASTFAITGTDETPITPFVVSTVAEAICYVNGYPDPTKNQTTCGTTTGGSWVAAGTGIVGVQGSLVLDGTMNANAIVAGTITGDLISGTTIQTTHLHADTIAATVVTSTNYVANTTGYKLGPGGAEFNDGLSSLSSDMGIIKAGKIESEDGKFVIDLDNKFIKIEV